MKKLFLATAYLMCCLTLVSCQQDHIEEDGMYSDEFMSKIKFKTITEEDLRNTVAEGTRAGSISLGIFSVRIARPSTGCKRGFGFCDFKWFPRNTDLSLDQFQNNELYEMSFAIENDQFGNKYVDLEIAERPTTLDVSRLQPLVVEETLESFGNRVEESMEVPQGTYSFDGSIGELGGYRIYLK